MKSKNHGHLLPLFIFLAFLIGIIIGRHLPLFWIFLIVCILCLSLVIFFHKRQRLLLYDIFIIVFFISLGTLWVIPSIKQDINSFLNKEAKFQIKVVSLPQEAVSRNIFYARIKKADKVPINKKIKIMDYTRGMEYLFSYQVQGKISKRNYKGTDFYTLWVKKDAEIKKLPVPFWDRFARRTTDYLLSVFKNNLSEQGYRFLASVFLGRREVLGEEKQLLTNAGVAHLFPMQYTKKPCHRASRGIAL
ncbi:MAG: DUF4131 domain-containing protein [Candidatus Omnitrophota bacterium]